jgi:hypothetical protein
LGGSGVIAGPVTISGTLAPGSSIGALTLGSTLNLAGGSSTVMELNKALSTNDSVTTPSSIAYGGTLVLKNISGALAVNDTFTLFNASAYSSSFSSVISQTPGQTVTWDTTKLAVNGTVKVLSVAPLAVVLTNSVSGGNLNLSWPPSQIGATLQSQTNSLNVGLSTNWVAVPGSTATNKISIPINSAAGSVFYRLLLP